MSKTTDLEERWQEVEYAAYAIDGASPKAAQQWLGSLSKAFSGCNPKTDWPGHATAHLIRSLQDVLDRIELRVKHLDLQADQERLKREVVEVEQTIRKRS